MRRLVVTLLMTGLLWGAVAPASAADEIGLSRDGEHWADTLTEPLFDSDTLWVPGDSRTVSFHVRNQAESNAWLTTTVRTDDRDNLMANDHVVLRARTGGRWFTLRNGEPSQELTAASIRPGAPVKVEIEATFDPRSSNASQADSLSLMFEVRLTDAAAGSDQGPGTDGSDDGPPDVKDPSETDQSDDETGGSPGWLPGTGGGTAVTVLWMAGILMAVGAALAVAGRRGKEREDV